MLGLRRAITQGIEQQVDDLASRLDEHKRRTQDDLTLLRRQMARVASGHPLSADAITEGRLFNDVPPAELNHLIAAREGLLILDVRTDAEWASGRIPGARHIPIDQLPRRLGELSGHTRGPVLAYCAAGGRSAAACDLLSQNGFFELYNAVGGIGAYKGALDR